MVRVELPFNGVKAPGKVAKIGEGTAIADLGKLRELVHDGKVLPPRDRSKEWLDALHVCHPGPCGPG